MHNLPLIPASLGSMPLLLLAALAALIYSAVQLVLPYLHSRRMPAGAQARAAAPLPPTRPGVPTQPPVPPRQPSAPPQPQHRPAHRHDPTPTAQPQHPAARPPYPTAAPQAQPNNDVALYANLLLGVAAAFLVIAAFIFVGIAQHALLRAITVIGVAVITYGAGLGIALLSSRLKPVGIALTAVGLVLLPISGAALGGLDITGAKTAWLVASVLGLISCALAAALLRSELVTWFGLLFIGSTVLSVINFGGPSFAYYGVGLVIVSMAFIIIGRVLEGPYTGRRTTHSRGAAGFRSFLSAERGQKVRWARPFVLLGQIIAPASGICALITLPDDSPWAKGVFWLVLTVFYIVLGICRSWTYALGAALLTSTIGITTLTGSLCRTSGSPAFGEGGRYMPVCEVAVSTAGIAASVVQILFITAAFAMFVRQGRKLTVLISLYISATILTVSTLAAMRRTFSIIRFYEDTGRPDDFGAAVDAVQLPLLLIAVFLVLAGIICVWAAWRADSAFLQATSAVSLAAAPLLGTGFSRLGPDWTFSAVILTLNTVMVVGHGALTFAARTKAGRQRRQLRSVSMISATVISIAGGLPFTLLVWSDSSTPMIWALFAASVVATAIFIGAAFFFRSAVISFTALCAAFGGTGALGFIISLSAGANYSAALFIPVAGIGSAVLWLVSHRLWLRGRTRRSWMAYALSIVWAASAASGLLRHTFFNEDGRVFSASVVMITAGIAAACTAAGAQAAVAYLRRTCPAVPNRRYLLTVPVLVFTGALWAVLITRFLGLPLAVVSIAFALTALAIAWMSLSLSIQWLQLPAGATLFVSLLFASSELTTSFSLTVLLAAWGTWAVAYAGHWILALLHRKVLASLITAALALVMALFSLPLVTLKETWLHDPKRAATGATIAILALMVFGAARFFKNPRHRLGCQEGASYLGAIALMLVIDGFIDTRFIVLWHVPVIVALTWALYLVRRGRQQQAQFPATDEFFNLFDLRILLAWLVLTVAGIAAATTGPGWLTVLFLADHVALLVLGALTSRQWALWWGLAACAAAVFWGLRNLVWLALVLLALMLIGIVVWMLLRPKKEKSVPTAFAGPPQPGAPPQPHPGGQAHPGYAPQQTHRPAQQPQPPGHAQPQRQQGHSGPPMPQQTPHPQGQQTSTAPPRGPMPPGQPARQPGKPPQQQPPRQSGQPPQQQPPRPSGRGEPDTAPPPGPGFGREGGHRGPGQ